MKECNKCSWHVQGVHPAAVALPRGATCQGCLETGMPYFTEKRMIHAHIPVFTAGDQNTPSKALPSDAATRKGTPIATGVLDYFPLAIAAIAQLSRVGNDQHNPGAALFWDRSKSGDESDALMRHFMERGTVDSDGVRHTTKVAWRALAMLQKELEKAAK